MRPETRERFRRTWPLLVVLVVVALSVIRWTGSVAGTEWRDALDERLADAGAGANAAMVEVERDHLSALRAFTFTTGVPEALAELDIEAIERLLGPIDANLGIPMVDVVDPSGRVVFAFRGEGQLPPIYRDRIDFSIVQRALRDEPDIYGERFTTMALTDEGALIASAGAVKLGDDVVGVLVVMTPLADVLTASTNQSGEMLTVYSADGGVPLATTAAVKPRTLPESLDRILPAEDLPVTSSYEIPGGSAREQLGALVVRHETVAWLGVADLDKSGRVSGQVSMLTAVAILLCSLLSVLLATRWRDTPSPTSDDDDAMPSIRRPVGALPTPAKERTQVPAGVGRTRW